MADNNTVARPYAQAVFDYLVARAQLDQATGSVPLVDGEPAATTGFQD